MSRSAAMYEDKLESHFNLMKDVFVSQLYK